MSLSPYDRDLDRNPANYQPLTPLSFLERAAAVFPDRLAIAHGALRRSYREFDARTKKLASALAKRGFVRGDTVAVMLANTPAMLECHYGVPMCGAVLNALNTRLDAASIAFMLDHGEAKALIVDREFSGVIGDALKRARVRPLVIDYDDPEYDGPGERLGDLDYEALIAEGDEAYERTAPGDEWDAIALNYTSGTTGDPKGVVYHHRGANLLAAGNILTADVGRHPVYLWTLPMFHCNGWCFPWSISVKAGVHVCLRQVRAGPIFDLIAEHKVTHMCGAPIVMSVLLNAGPDEKRPLPHVVRFFTAAAPPPAAVLKAMGEAGFEVTHLYGLTEVYGPAVVNDWKEEWNALDAEAQAHLKARQGVRYHALEALDVMDPETMQSVPADGQTMGEVMFRGNVVMKGLSQKQSLDRQGVRRRLVPFGRPRRQAQGRLRATARPVEGHHHFRRREHFVDRGRGRFVRAPGRPARGGGGAAGRQMGRDAVRFRRDEAGQERDRRGAHRMVSGAARALQVPAPCRLRGNPQDLDRQGAEVRAARARKTDRGGASLADAVRRLAAILPRRVGPVGGQRGGAVSRSRRRGAEAGP